MYNTDDYKGTICTIILISCRRETIVHTIFPHIDRFITWVNKISSRYDKQKKKSENDKK